jgi:hypothetical protein
MRLYEITNPEQLDEGPVGKALATAALGLGLQFGQQVNADEVYVYQDKQGQLQTAQSIMQVPDDSPLSYVIDTDTQQIKYLKQPNQNQLTPVKDEPITAGKELWSGIKLGMTLEQVQQIKEGGKVARKQFREVKALQMDPAMYRTFDAPGGWKKLGATYYHFNTNNKLTGITFHYVLPDRSWADGLKKMKKWNGYDVNDMAMVINKMFTIMPQEIKPSAIGKTQISTGGEFSAGLTVSKLAQIGGNLGAIGINLGSGKMGDLKYKIQTNEGYILLDGSFAKDSLGHSFDFSGLSGRQGIYVIVNK